MKMFLKNWEWATLKDIAARGRITFVFQVGLIEASDSSLERYWLGDQKLSLEQVKKINGLAARGRKTIFFQVSPIKSSDSSLERYWIGDQKLSLEQVDKLNG